MNKNINIPKTNYPAYLSLPNNKEKVSSIILIHEIWGLNDHIKDVADRFANQGYATVAVDLFSDENLGKIDQSILLEMQDPDKRDEAQKKMRLALTPMNSPEFSERMRKKLQEAYEYMINQDFSNGKVGVIGFCFGGTYSYQLAVDEPNLTFSIPFYGHAPKDLNDLKKINCPILAFYGEEDTQLAEEAPKIKEIMDQNNKEFEYVIYPNTGHAFFNDTNKNMYRKESAEDAWKRVLEFLKNKA